MGCWSAAYMEVCKRYLEDFPIAYIGFSLFFARSFLKVPNINFNLFQRVLVGPMGNRFMKAARKAGRVLLVWTVNDEEWMEWSIRKEVDGVITDDPKKFLEVCKRHEATAAAAKDLPANGGPSLQLSTTSRRSGVRRWTRLYLELVAFNVMTTIFTGVFIYMLGWPSTQAKKHLLTERQAVRQVS